MALSSARSWALALAAGAAACVAAEPEGSSTGVARQAILGGDSSPPTEDAVVFLRSFVDDKKASNCTATFVSPTLLLTARHCLVTDNVGMLSETACTLGTNLYPPQAVHVEIGNERRSLKPASAVKRFIMDFDSSDCINDIAAIELVEPVTGLALPPLELDAPPTVGGEVTSIGWGLVDDEGTFADARKRQAGKIIGISSGNYPTEGGSRFVKDGYLMTSNTLCFGDSGSPLIDSRGAMIGLFSAKLNLSESSYTCAGTSAMYIPLYRHAKFVERVFQATGQMPPRAGKPLPANLGGACTQNNECHSNLCIGVGSRSMCSKACKADADCAADGLVCTDTGYGYSACLDAVTPPAADASACAVSTGSSRGGVSGTGLMIACGALVLAARRSRRCARAQR